MIGPADPVLPTDPAAPSVPHQLSFHYIKSNFFRVVHGDGVYGGPTPKGNMAMMFFSERSPIAEKMVHNFERVPGEGDVVVRVGEEIRELRVAKDGVVREVEVEVIMDLPNAKAFASWLQANIEKMERGA